MTAAYRLKGIGWFGGCVVVVLGFYLVSLQVANERKKLEGMNRRIASAERDIRALETEFDTRANLVQLEKWNGDTLALAAPTAGQFVGDENALAAIDVTAGPGGDAGLAMRTAALVVPSGVPALAPPQPAMTLVAATAPIAQASAAPVAAAARAAAVSPAGGRATSTAAIRTAAAIVRARPEAVAMLDRKLLSDSTLGDILATARTEAGKR